MGLQCVCVCLYMYVCVCGGRTMGPKRCVHACVCVCVAIDPGGVCAGRGLGLGLGVAGLGPCVWLALTHWLTVWAALEVRGRWPMRVHGLHQLPQVRLDLRNSAAETRPLSLAPQNAPPSPAQGRTSSMASSDLQAQLVHHRDKELGSECVRV